MTLNLDDYFITVESLSNFHDNDIDKWISSSKNPSRIEKKLKKLSEFGGKFKANHFNALSTDLVDIPFVFKSDNKWSMQYGKARMVHFFPTLEYNLDETMDMDKSKISMDITQDIDCSNEVKNFNISKINLINDVTKVSTEISNEKIKKSKRKNNETNFGQIEINESKTEIKEISPLSTNDINITFTENKDGKKRKLSKKNNENDINQVFNFERENEIEKSPSKKEIKVTEVVNDPKNLDLLNDNVIGINFKEKADALFNSSGLLDTLSGADNMPDNINKKKSKLTFTENERMTVDINEVNVTKKSRKSKKGLSQDDTCAQTHSEGEPLHVDMKDGKMTKKSHKSKKSLSQDDTSALTFTGVEPLAVDMNEDKITKKSLKSNKSLSQEDNSVPTGTVVTNNESVKKQKKNKKISIN